MPAAAGPATTASLGTGISKSIICWTATSQLQCLSSSWKVVVPA